MLRRMPGESDLGFYGSESEDQQAFLDEGPYAPDEDAIITSEESSTSYSPGYRDTYTATAATSVPLSPWCIVFYIVLPCFALFGLVVMIYYWGCCPSCLGCYRDDDDDNKVWRDQSQKVRGGSEKTEGTAENDSAPSLKPNGVPTSIAISIPDESAQPQKQHIQRDNKPPAGAPEVPSSSSWRSWLHRSKKSGTSVPPSSSTGL